MKKDWIAPELKSLEISATAGGPFFDDLADGPAVWRDNCWWLPVGKDPVSQ